MGTNGTKANPITHLFELTADRIGHLLGLMAIMGVKAWHTYTERRNRRSAGRRASDRDHQAVMQGLSRCETITKELTVAVTILSSRVTALERQVERKD